jgi:hypothetical protein
VEFGGLIVDDTITDRSIVALHGSIDSGIHCA